MSRTPLIIILQEIIPEKEPSTSSGELKIGTETADSEADKGGGAIGAVPPPGPVRGGHCPPLRYWLRKKVRKI